MRCGHVDEEAIFAAALDRRDPSERAALLKEMCGENAELQVRIETLLNAHDDPGAFLDTPVKLVGPHDDSGYTEGPGTVIGRYKLLELIGEGGFGDVYMAEQQEPVRRKVALKIIKLGMDTKQVIARFEAERQALALMDHPNIAKVLDAGATDSGRPYFVMELVRGIAVTDYCDGNHLTTKERLKLFIDVCHAVQHAHQKGIIHRDVKPTNVMVTQQDGRPVPKVIDFGIAKATEHRLTEKTLYTTYRQLIGTPEYMSPEQATFCEADIDTRSDIYSLGVLLYELLVGTTPFDAEALRSHGYDEICRVIRESDPPTPSKRLSTMGEVVTEISKHRHVEPAALRKLLRGDLDWIVMKALEKDRTQRYETVHGLSRDIDRHLSDEPVVACPPSVPYRIKKFARKHRGPVTAVAAIGATFLIGLALAIVAFAHARRELHMRVRQLYVSDVNSAYQAWQEPNLGRARDLLSRHLPRAGGRDLRGFEWHYLWARLQRALRPTFEGQSFTSVAFSPDGSRLAAGTWEGTVKLWDVATHQEVDTFVHSSNGVRAVAFSPDGKRLVSVCSGHVVRLWDVPTGAVVRTLRHEAPKEARNATAAFSPDGRTLAVGCGDYFSGEITLWDPAGGGELGRLVGHKAAVAGVAFSSNGQFLASASLDSTVKLWDLAKRRVVRTLSGHTDRVFAVAFSPDGRTVASGSSDSTVKLWDVTSGDMRREFTGPASHVMSVAFSPDGETVAVGVSDSKVMLWRVRDGKLVHTFLGHSGPVWSVAFSPNGMQLASVGNRAKLWDVDALQPVSTDHRWRTAMAISPVDHKTLIVGYGQHVPGSTTGIAGLWNTATREYHRLSQRNERPIFCLAASRDGRLLALGGGQLGAQGFVQVWDMRVTQLLWTMPIGKTPVWSVAFSADGSRLVSGEWDNRLTFWDVSAGQPRRTLNLESFAATCMALSPDGMTLAIGGGNFSQGDIVLWDVASDTKRITLRGHGSVVWSLDFSRDGKLLASGGWDSAVKLWDMDTLQELQNCAGHTIHVQAVCFSPDGATLASGSLDSTVKLWHVNTGEELATLKAPAPVTSVLFFPDGRTLAAGCQDRSVKLWHTDAEEVVLRPE